jgi:hypothetical protein
MNGSTIVTKVEEVVDRKRLTRGKGFQVIFFYYFFQGNKQSNQTNRQTSKKRFLCCEISGSHGGECEDYSLPGCSAVRSRSRPTFQRCILPPIIRAMIIAYFIDATRCYIPEDSNLSFLCSCESIKTVLQILALTGCAL